jgi:hypothetical protein
VKSSNEKDEKDFSFMFLVDFLSIWISLACGPVPITTTACLVGEFQLLPITAP